jgi:hypothetical protein
MQLPKQNVLAKGNTTNFAPDQSSKHRTLSPCCPVKKVGGAIAFAFGAKFAR